MTKNEVVMLHQVIGKLSDIRDSRLAYAVIKNGKKLESEREVIIETIEKLRGELTIDQWVNTEEGKEFLNTESSIELHKLQSMPVVELTANEMSIIEMFVSVTDDSDGKPVGPPVKP